ncbi:MAG TPA: glycosyltransferase [Bauldia sp.]|nr:glycosyltransferase [Bauldia sp.]
MFQVLGLFAAKRFDVDLWAPETNVDDRYPRRLTARGIRIHRLEFPPSRQFKRWLRRNGRELDLVFLSRPEMARQVIDLVRQFSAAKILFYGHDLHHVRLKMQAARTGAEHLMAEAEAVEAVENAIWRQADIVYYPSAEECDYVKRRCRANGQEVDARVLPIFGFGGFEKPSTLSPHGRSGVLFVGGFGHSPNVDGMLWFARDVWPAIASASRGTRLLIAGSHPPPEVLALAGETIDVSGFITDDALKRAYRRARVAVAPLRFGAGMKGKVVESMRFGLPMVTTSVGAQGLADAGDALLVADDADGQVELVLKLLREDPLWERTAMAANGFARQHFSREGLWAALAAAL